MSLVGSAERDRDIYTLFFQLKSSCQLQEIQYGEIFGTSCPRFSIAFLRRGPLQLPKARPFFRSCQKDTYEVVPMRKEDSSSQKDVWFLPRQPFESFQEG